jgi:hypothetical protein
MSTVKKFEDVAVDKFTYGPPVPNKSKTITNINMNYEKGRPKIQSPLLGCPFGFSVMVDKKKPNADPSYTIELSLDDDTQKSRQFKEWVQQIDDRTMSDAKANSNAWMKRATLSDAIAKELFYPALKCYKDPKTKQISDQYAPRIRFKLMRKNGKFTTKVFDQHRQPVNFDEMSIEQIKGYGKHYKMKVIFEVGGVWAGAKGFGVTFRASQVILYPLQKLTGFGFLHDVEDDLIFGEANAVTDEADEADEDENHADVPEVNSDEEDEPAEAVEETVEEETVVEEVVEEADEEVVEEEPEPKPKKKATRAKKSTTKQATLPKYSKKKADEDE